MSKIKNKNENELINKRIRFCLKTKLCFIYPYKNDMKHTLQVKYKCYFPIKLKTNTTQGEQFQQSWSPKKHRSPTFYQPYPSIRRNPCTWWLTSLYHCQDYYRTWLHIWVPRRVSYKKQEMLTIREYLSSLSVYWWGPCCSLYFYSFLCCSIMCLHVLSSVLWCLLWFPYKNDVRFIFTSSYSNTFAHSDVQHILCCVLVLLFFVLCTLCCQFLWIIYFWSMILCCFFRDSGMSWLVNYKAFLIICLLIKSNLFHSHYDILLLHVNLVLNTLGINYINDQYNILLTKWRYHHYWKWK